MVTEESWSFAVVTDESRSFAEVTDALASFSVVTEESESLSDVAEPSPSLSAVTDAFASFSVVTEESASFSVVTDALENSVRVMNAGGATSARGGSKTFWGSIGFHEDITLRLKFHRVHLARISMQMRITREVWTLILLCRGENNPGGRRKDSTTRANRSA